MPIGRVHNPPEPTLLWQFPAELWGRRFMTAGRGVGPVNRTIEIEAPVCDYCGCHILKDEQQCPARDDGRRCYP